MSAVAGQFDQLEVGEAGEVARGGGVDHVVVGGDDDERLGADAGGGLFQVSALGDVVGDHGFELRGPITWVLGTGGLGLGQQRGSLLRVEDGAAVGGLQGELVHGLDGGHGLGGVGAGLLEGTNGAELRVPEEKVAGVEAWGADDGDGAGGHFGVADDPFEGLHPAHGDAGDGVEAGDAEAFSEQAALGFDHAGDGDFGEGGGRIRGRTTDAVAEGIDSDDEQAGGVEGAAGADHGFEAGGSAIEPGGEQDGVGFRGVEFPIGAEAEAAFGDAAAAGIEAAEDVELLVGRRCGKGGGEGGEDEWAHRDTIAPPPARWTRIRSARRRGPEAGAEAGASGARPPDAIRRPGSRRGVRGWHTRSELRQ